MKKVKVGELKFSEELLSLRKINPFVVCKYRQAMRVGDEFPPMIIDKATNEIVSGNHRATAYLEEFGEDYLVPCEFETYASEADKIKRFAEENARHGMALDGISKRAIAIKLSGLGTSPDDIAKIFGVSVKSVLEWGEQSVYVIGNTGKTGMKTLEPIKNGLPDSVRGTTITREEYGEHRNVDLGIPDHRLAEQLVRHLRSGWVNMDDDRTRDAMENLKAELDKIIE